MSLSVMESMFYEVFICICLFNSIGLGNGNKHCPDGWFNRYGSCYLITRDQHQNTWEEARIKCQALKADLVDIRSSKERDWLINTLTKLVKSTTYTNWWVGINARTDGETFQNANGSSVITSVLRSSVWQRGASIPSKDKACVVFNYQKSLLQLAVRSCDGSYQIICKRKQNIPLTCDIEGGWTHYSGMCYKKYGNAETHADAISICSKADGATLPVIANDGTQRVLFDYAKLFDSNVWTGITAVQEGSTYTWSYSGGSTNTVVKTFYWFKGQPGTNVNVNYTCVEVNKNAANYSVAWVTSSCKSKKLALCQRPEGVCPDGWLQYGQNCYRFYSTLATFRQASLFCHKLGGNLFTPTTKYVQQFVSSYLRNQRKAGMESFWIGIEDRGSTTSWYYTYGSTLGKYSKWTKNGGKHTKDSSKYSCVYMLASDKRGYWRTTTNCFYPKSYICQINSEKQMNHVTVPKFKYQCDPTWKVYGDQCFFFYTSGSMNFYHARSYCAAQNADLAIILSQDIEDFISDYISHRGWFWIGLLDQDRENVFTWVDAKVDVNYTNWVTNEPNNYHNNENCVVLEGTGANYLKWNDISCAARFFFICQKGAHGVANTITTTDNPRPFSVKCGPFWEEAPNSDFCYQFWNKGKTWFDAKLYCNSNGGDLLSITSSQEQRYLSGRIIWMGTKSLWIGANDLTIEGGFEWSDKSPFSYMNWIPGEPNNAGNNEECASMVTTTGQWNDWICSQRAAFVCKKRGMVTATTPPQSTSPATLPNNMAWTCPRLWKGFRGSCYLYVPDKMSHTYADLYCKTQSGNLASIAGAAENSFIQAMIPAGGRTTHNIVWIGLNDVELEGEFKWSDGTHVSYTNWASGDPNNKGGNQDCVSMMADRGGGWVDDTCQNLRASVCRKPKSIIPKETYSDGCTQYPGSLGYRGFCYQFNTFPTQSWNNAERDCRGKHGHLASIYDNHVQAYLAAEITLRGDHFWIGLSDYTSPGTYTWSSGTLVDYTSWSEIHTGNEKKTCVVMRSFRPIGLWTNMNCTETHSYICELPRTGYTNPVITQTTASSLPCPSGWDPYQAHCFKAFIAANAQETQTWSEALQTCRTYGGDLASIHSKDQANFFKTTVIRSTKIVDFFWIGLNDRNAETSYEWTDGSPFLYHNWAYKQPDDNGHQEDCVQFFSITNQWFDENCYFGHSFICQIQKGQTIPPSTIPPTAITSVPECGNSTWQYYGGYCYYLSPVNGPDARKSYYAAQRFCNANGAHLASVQSMDENNFLTAVSGKQRSDFFLIGLSNLDLQGYNTWSDGTPVRFLNWGTNQPNDNNGGSRCVLTLRGVWQNTPCGMVNSYICKKRGRDTKPITPPPLVLKQGGCPPNFIAARGSSKCYYFGAASSRSVEKKMTFNDAVQACRNIGHGVNIASINSYIEQLTITMSMKDQAGGFWIGLNDQRRNGLFVWQDNSEVTYTNWGKHEPSENLHNLLDQQDCVLVVPRGKGTSGGYWVDAPCSYKKGFICQIDRNPLLPNPTPSTKGCTASGYQHYDRSCYMLKPDKRNWPDAQTACQKDGGNLVSIGDIYEQAFISLLVKTNTGYSWLGLNDQLNSGDYQWIDATTKVTYTYWGNNEPSKRDGEGCVAMEPNNRWDDTTCTKQLTYVCEIIVTKSSQQKPKQQGVCANTWTPYQGRCFKDYSNITVPWNLASTICRYRRAELVSIHNKNEDSFVAKLIKFSTNDIWLGLQRAIKGGYQYTDRTPVNFLNWDDGEPSDVNHTIREDCVARVAATGKWDDLICSFKKGFICVKSMLFPTTAANVNPFTNKLVTQNPAITNGLRTQKLHGTTNLGTNNKPTKNKQKSKSSPGISDGGVAGIVITVLVLIIASFAALHFMAKKYNWTFNSLRHGQGFSNALYNTKDDAVDIQS